MIEWIIGVYLFCIAFGLIVSYLQIGHIRLRLSKKALFLKEDDYKKAGEYAIANQKMSIFGSVVEVITLLIWLLFGLSLLESEISFIESDTLRTTLFIMSLMVIGGIISFPMDIYSKFVIDKKYGFSKKLSFKLYMSDFLKSTIIFFIVGFALISLMAYFIDNNQYWWIISFGILFTFILGINILYPVIRGAFFDNFKPLEDGELKDKINQLLESVDFKSSGVFSVDASKRDSRLNAYFGGLGKTKRVVLYDTLIEKLNVAELISVLGHELGHFKNKDIIKGIASMSLVLLCTFYALGQLPDTLANEIGMNYGSSFIISMFLLLSPVIFFIANPIISFISRHNEFEADKFGINKGSKEDLATALLKLVNENLSFPFSHKLYSFIHHSHPSIQERLEAMGFDVYLDLDQLLEDKCKKG